MKNIPDRELIIERCKAADACDDEFARLIAAETYEEFWRVLVANYRWCYFRNILEGITHPENYEFITELPYGDLRGFEFDLPNLKTVGGSLYLNGYYGNLPSLKRVGGRLYLKGYKGNLPNLKSVGGWLNLKGYTGELPSLKTVGGSLYLNGYSGNFPSLETVGGQPYIKSK